jgi:hypothetical protein
LGCDQYRSSTASPVSVRDDLFLSSSVFSQHTTGHYQPHRPKELTESEGWRVIVENRPGGVTTIAATDVLSQPADGHSLYADVSRRSRRLAGAQHLIQPRQGLRTGHQGTVSYNVLVVNPSVHKPVAELVG